MALLRSASPKAEDMLRPGLVVEITVKGTSVLLLVLLFWAMHEV